MLVNEERFKRKLREQELDAVVAATIENVHYLTGISSVSLGLHPYIAHCYAAATVDAPARPSYVSSVGEVDQVLDGFAGIEDVATFGSFFREERDDVRLALEPAEQRLKSLSLDTKPYPKPVQALAEALRRAGLEKARIGLDGDGMDPASRQELASYLPQARFTEASGVLSDIRRVKTPEEIRRLQRAARITEQAIRAASAIAREGVTEYELQLEFNRAIVSQGAWPKFTMIHFGRKGVGGQVLPDRTPLRKGDTIWFDVGCVCDGYWSDLARNVAFGEPASRARVFYNALKHGEDEALRSTRPGMSAKDLFDVMVNAVRENGIPHYRRHHVGHGIGAEIYETPVLTATNETEIEAGMVLNVETPYYEFGIGALHVEDPFVDRKSVV